MKTVTLTLAMLTGALSAPGLDLITLNSDYLRVTVGDKETKMEYVRPDGSVAHTYSVLPR